MTVSDVKLTHPLSPAAVEAVARLIYDDMPFDGKGSKPEWTERGNSFKQDEARSASNRYLSAAFEQSRLEGNARDGFGWEIPEGWEADTYKKRDVTDFPVTIIRKAKP